ncbi:hypothetical protein F3Y22_tig00002840pilonHSYRG00476 [Hibiscus syriacus]|uniref:RNase H type-1 domain-containing protein n=1 Tax=Hibiscus syriacus TaxID=106335 RepID=A0A6A3CP45_HIBSY|nr:hypothetical protein F3Y22_tig00002840pilonHSYRG00476 [Hibiscus syriacus]
MDLTDWLLHNSLKNERLANETQWLLFFASLTWQIWKKRNEKVFNGTRTFFQKTLKLAITWAHHFENSKLTPQKTSSESNQTAWQPPTQGSYCINTDGAVSLQTRHGTAVGLIRNSNGQWEGGFNKNIGNCSALQAELWGIFEGLRLAQNLGMENMIIQTDSVQAIKSLEDPSAANSSLALVRAITKLRNNTRTTKLEWIPRKSNYASDKLAKLAPTGHFQLLVYESPPTDLLQDLLVDEHAANLHSTQP